MSRSSCVMGCESLERTHRQARALCHLYAQVDRVQSRACLQLARCPTRGLRGIYKEPRARRLAADPRPLQRRRILRRLSRPAFEQMIAKLSYSRFRSCGRIAGMSEVIAAFCATEGW